MANRVPEVSKVRWDLAVSKVKMAALGRWDLGELSGPWGQEVLKAFAAISVPRVIQEKSAFKVFREIPVRLVRKVTVDRLVLRVIPVPWDLQVLKETEEKRENVVPLGNKDQRVFRDRKENLDHKVFREIKDALVRKENRAFRVRKVLLVPKEILVYRDLREISVHKVKKATPEKRANKAFKVQKATKVTLALKGKKVIPEKRANKAFKVQKATRVISDLREKKATPEKRANRVSKVSKAIRVIPGRHLLSPTV